MEKWHNVGDWYRGKDNRVYQKRECPKCHAGGNKNINANFWGTSYIKYHCIKCGFTWRDLA